MTRCPRYSLLVAAMAILSVAVLGAQTHTARFESTDSTATWTTSSDHGGAVLRISGPGGLIERQLEAGASVTLGIEDFMALGSGSDAETEGAYNWELWFQRGSSDGNRLVTKTRAADGGDMPSRDRDESEGAVARGMFSLYGGAFIEPSEEGGEDRTLVTKAGPTDVDVPGRDQQILDDLIVDGSACVGQDCVNGESFGFDTIRLKENNLRIRFVDTSSTSSFPSRDWQLTANDSSNGGANKFSIDDIDGGRTPFTIEAGAPSHSLYVDDSGRLGLGTSTPVVDAHVVDGNTPTLRLEQNGSSGFSPQTWDVAGNETNFFVRDASNGSTLPFRIFPSAPSNTLIVSANGSLASGTTTPEAWLHLKKTDGDTHSRIFSKFTGDDFSPQSEFENQTLGIVWRFGMNGTGDFVINDTADLGTAELRVTPSGQVYVNGTVEHPDYVFAPGYELRDLAELESFVMQNRHLPGIPSVADREEERGLDIANFPVQLLEKIEELTLYTFEQNRQIEALRSQNESLAARLEALENND